MQREQKDQTQLSTTGSYASLPSSLPAAWHTGLPGRALLLSLLGHLLVLGALWSASLMLPVSKRKFQLSDATTTQQALQVSMKMPRPALSLAERGQQQEQGGGDPEQVSRFNSDVLQQNRREIYNSIVYPRIARKMGWEGRVKIQAIVAPEGRVLQAAVVSSSGYGVLDDAALRGVRAHSFTPGAGTERIVLSFRFKLNK